MIQETAITSPTKPGRWQWRVAALLAALAACAGLRLWLIQNTAIITKDGTIYIRMARQWAGDPMGVVRDYDYAVGYPAAISAAHDAVARLTGTTGVTSWELAGKAVSLLAALAAMVAVWIFARRAFDTTTAWIAVLLFGAGAKWTMLGADVVSDAPAVCLQLWSAVAGLWALDLLERRSRKMLLAAALTGLCAGAGYLVRPESLMIVGIASLLWLAWQIRWRLSWRLTLSSIVVAAAAAVAAGAPYMIAIGGLTKKKTFGDVLFGGTCASAWPMANTALAGAGQVDALNVLAQLVEAMQPVLAVLAGLYLATAAVTAVRPRFLAGVLPRPRGKEAALMLLAALVTLPIMLSLSRLPNYPSYRHMMVLAALLAPLAAAELKGIARALAPGRQRWQSVILVVLTAALYAGLTLHAANKTHSSMSYYKRAANWLAVTAGPQDRILSDTAWILHYSDLPGWPPINLDYQTENDLRKRIEEDSPPATYLAISTDILAGVDQRCAGQGKNTVSELLNQPMFVLVKEFRRDGKSGDAVRIYRIDRSRPGFPATATRPTR